MSLFDGPVKKINIPINYYRSSVCLTAAVIFARLRWWGSWLFNIDFLISNRLNKKLFCFSYCQNIW